MPDDSGLRAALRRSVAVIESLERRLDRTTESVAVVGMACRFPGAPDVDAFWWLLEDGVDAITDIPAGRWDVDRYYDPDPASPGTMNSRRGGFVDGVAAFDAAFFGMSPREAARTDPQHRMLLEVAWEALEHAGQAPRALRGSWAGVFVGIAENDYAKLVDRLTEDTGAADPYDATGTGGCFAAGRLSHVLGLRGPSIAVDTGCSSALVAMHQAVSALRGGECDLALAGGVHLRLAPQTSIALSRTGALAPDGRCKPFAEAADGFGRSEGCGIIVLKRLSDALAARDPILAVVRGSAVNHDGPASGLTAPSEQAQAALVTDALGRSGVAPDRIGFVEAHGTGTVLGDPIEVGALATAFGDVPGPVWIGSVKSNIGHTEGAAGAASVIKTVLSIAHGRIPRSLHADPPNPYIDWAGVPFVVPSRTEPWPAGRPYAGVSSFGMGGTNAHLVLGPPPDRPVPPPPARPVLVLPLSARTPEALGVLVGRWADAAGSGADPAALCLTASTGRTHFPVRAAVSGRTAADLAEALRARRAEAMVAVAGRPAVVFLFTGEDVPADLGGELYDAAPVFRATADECAPIVEKLGGPDGRTRGFVLGLGLARLWRSWGVTPVALLGHGAGEPAAACAAGTLPVEDALRRALSGDLPAAGPGMDEGPAATIVAMGPAPGDRPGVLASVRAGREWPVLAATLATLYERGAEIDWHAFEGDHRTARTAAPTYPFQRQAHWLPDARPRAGLFTDVVGGPPGDLVAEGDLHSGIAALAQHRVAGRNVVPAAFHLAALLDAAALAAPGRSAELTGVVFPAPLVLPAAATVRVRARLGGDGECALEAGTTHAAGSWRAAEPVLGDRRDLVAIRARLDRTVGVTALYDRLARSGIELGPAYRWLTALRTGAGEALADVSPQPVLPVPHAVHPGLIDACFQVTEALRDDADTTARLPFAVDRLALDAGGLGRARHVHARRGPDDRWQLTILDGDGTPVGVIDGFRDRPAADDTGDRPAAGDGGVHRWLARRDWSPAAAAAPAGLPDRLVVLGDDTPWTVAVAAALDSGPAGRLDADPGPAVHVVVVTEPDATDDAARAERLLVLLLTIVRRLGDRADRPALTLLTRGGQNPSGPDAEVAPSQTAVWAFARTIAAEYPGLRCRVLDAAGEDDLPEVAARISDPSSGNRLAVRGRAYDEVFHPVALPVAPSPVRLALGRYGTPDALSPVPLVRRPPGPGEIEIEVRAAGLNFRDVLIALGLLGEDRPAAGVPLGYECAGVVVATGPGVRDRPIGTDVMAYAEGSFATHVTVRADHTAPLPAGAGHPDGATIPMAFLTARYGLDRLAGVRAGDRVLVHAAAGGVGQAAVALAKRAGAEVFGTAAVPKHGTLRRLGADHVLNSRDTGYAAEILRRTGGRGADVVLNSLTGDHIPASLRALAPGGRFVELGRVGIWTPPEVADARPDVRYLPFDLGDVADAEPDLIRDLFAELLPRFASGELAPLPLRAFPMAAAPGAYRLMQRAGHTGKVVLVPPGAAVPGSAGVLVTGGLGALGLRAARLLAEAGVRRLVLFGRSAPDAAATAAIGDLRSRGVHVEVVRGDVAVEDDVRRAIAATGRLGGVVHAAGSLADGVLAGQTPERFAAVLRPKVRGAALLDRLSRPHRPALFVIFSSIAAVEERGGQGAYGAANAFLDGLIARRRAEGLPGLGVNWGPWAGTGMAAELAGARMIPPASGDALLRRFLAAGSAVPPSIVVDPGRGVPPPREPGPEPAGARAAILAAAPAGRAAAMTGYLAGVVRRLVQLPASVPLDDRSSFAGAGVDSLVLIEFGRQVQRDLGLTVPASAVFDQPTLGAMAAYLLTLMAPAPMRRQAAAADPAAMPDLDAAGADDLRRLLDEELGALDEGNT